MLEREEAVRTGALPDTADPRRWLPWLELHARGKLPWALVVRGLCGALVRGRRLVSRRADPVSTIGFTLAVAGAIAAVVYYAVYCARYLTVIKQLIAELASRWDAELREVHER